MADPLDPLLAGLIPASADGRVPSAAEMGLAPVLRRLAETDTDLARAIESCLAGLPETPDTDAIRALERAEPAAFALLLRHLYMACYSRPDARALFGLSPAPTQPEGYAVPPEPAALLDELTAPVRARGPLWRNAEGAEHGE